MTTLGFFCLLALATFILVMGCVFSWKTIKLIVWGVKTGGVVVEKGYTTNGNVKMTYPIIEFETLTGEKRKHTGRAEYPDRVVVGKTIPILYLPNNPKCVLEKHWNTLILIPACLFLMGTFLLFAALREKGLL